MGIISWIIFGALAGWVASMLANTNEEQGAIGNILIGIIGAFIGGMLMEMLGGSGVTGFNFRSFLVAILGAVILLVIYKAVRGRA